MAKPRWETPYFGPPTENWTTFGFPSQEFSFPSLHPELHNKNLVVVVSREKLNEMRAPPVPFSSIRGWGWRLRGRLTISLWISKFLFLAAERGMHNEQQLRNPSLIPPTNPSDTSAPQTQINDQGKDGFPLYLLFQFGLLLRMVPNVHFFSYKLNSLCIFHVDQCASCNMSYPVIILKYCILCQRNVS